MDRSTDRLHREVERRLASDASRAAASATGWVAELIRTAYIEGVRDGYVQGVIAASSLGEAEGESPR